MIEQLQTGSTRLLAFKLSEQIQDDDYRILVPAVDAAVAVGHPLRMFVEFADYHGWDLVAAWEDLRFAVVHPSAFERIALVGAPLWEESTVRLCKPFARTTIRYFIAPEATVAWSWLREGDV